VSGLRPLSLGAKINVGLLLFLLLLAAAASGIIVYGFRRAQDDASDRSQEALEEQGKLALQALVGGVSTSGGLQVEWAAEIGQRASRYLQEHDAKEPAPSVDTSGFARTDEGVWYDPAPDRSSDVVVPNHVVRLMPAHIDDIAYSAALDPLFPALVEGFPGELSGEGFRPIAVVFVGINGVGRYYPPIGVHETTPAEVDTSDFYDRFGPVANPDRLSTWTPPYEDIQGRGLVMTAQTPVYQGDVFRGIFEVDLSIDGLAAELNSIRPTPGGFAFYVDTEGGILRSGAFDLLSREASQNEQLASVLENMRRGVVDGTRPSVERITLADREYFVSYGPLPAAGGSIGVAAPVDEVTEQAAPIAAGIRDQGTRTLQIMLAALGALFIAGLAGATYLNRQLLLAPLRRLTAATRQVAGGDLTVNVALGRRDELGELASDFNVMVEQLRESERVLEQRVEDRTRELSGLLEVTRVVSSTLQLQPLLQLVLEQTATVLPCDRSVITLRRDGGLRTLAVRAGQGDPDPTLARQVGMRFPLAPDSVLLKELAAGDPLIIDDVQAGDALAQAYRDEVGRYTRAAVERVRSWMAIPLMIKGELAGLMTIAVGGPNVYTPAHAALGKAIASQVAIAIDNAQLFEQTQRQARDLEVLSRADAELFRSLDLDGVLQSLVDVAVDLLGAHKCLVTLWDRGANSAEVRAARNFSPEGLDLFRKLLPSPGLGSLRDDVEPTVHPGPDAPGVPPAVRAIMEVEGVRAAMDVPIRSAAGSVLGGYGVAYTQEHEFSADERGLLLALAERAAVAIQNADLFSRAQHAASLEERQRLARELHDSVSQALYGIALGARTARLRLGDDPHNAAEPVDYVAALAQAGLAEMRALIFELRPESLEEEGLVAALEKQAASIAARYKLDVVVDLGEEPACTLDAKEALYRIAQEALHNVVKHAQARRVEVRLRRNGGSIELVVRDDGRGFDTAQSFPGHVGLQSMPERARKLGGAVSVESAPGHGTTVAATLPAR
jgi:signal transduction histidine kinase